MKKQVNFEEDNEKKFINEFNDIQPKLDFARQHKKLIFVAIYVMLCGIGLNIYSLIKLISLIF